MAAYVGVFYGYRGYVLVGGGGRIQFPLWEMMGKIPTRNSTYQGNAADAYGVMTQFTRLEQSEVIWVQTWDESLMFKLSTDGVNYQDEAEVDPDLNLGSWFHRASARGFAIRNKTPGSVARYQLVAFFV